ncbi:MAG: hypothetical protein JST26_04645 [Bacteroidetes bacterium]|nr:hypothetical protein [Bacteroidota bacterium]
MKPNRLLHIAFMCLLLTRLQAQLQVGDALVPCVHKPDTVAGQTVYLVADSMPEYPGGLSCFLKYLHQHIKSPQETCMPLYSTIHFTFVIDTAGKPCQICVLPVGAHKIYTETDQSIVEALQGMPAWTPGYKSGKKVFVRMNFPVKICLK